MLAPPVFRGGWTSWVRERLEAALPHPVCTSQVTLWDHDTGRGATGVSHARGGVSGISQHQGRDLGTTALCRHTGELPSIIAQPQESIQGTGICAGLFLFPERLIFLWKAAMLLHPFLI